MRTEEAISFYGGRSANLARALGCGVYVVSSWGDEPPRGRQFEIEVITGGALKARRDWSEIQKIPNTRPKKRVGAGSKTMKEQLMDRNAP